MAVGGNYHQYESGFSDLVNGAGKAKTASMVGALNLLPTGWGLA